jgi:hypothetical protein
MQWSITYPHRETLRYECESGSFDFEMAWGSEIPVLFVSGDTFRKTHGEKISVSDREMELFLARFREHCKTTQSVITISRTRDDSDYLPSHYK